MAKTPPAKKTASRPPKTTPKPAAARKRTKKSAGQGAKEKGNKVSGVPLKQIKKAVNRESEMQDNMADATREQLKKLGDKLSEATDKGVHVARDIADRVRHFASEATELTKLKVEIHKLKNAQDRLIFDIGSKFVELYKNQKLSNIESVFADDLTQLEYIKSQIAIKEKGVNKISL